MTQTKRKKSDYIIQSVDHALDVMEAFHGEEDELGITELSRRLKLHKNNIFRILATLENRGYIDQNRVTDNYRLGLETLELGQTYIRHTGLLRVARPITEGLGKKVNENVYIGILKENYAFYLDVVESAHTVRVLSRVGCRVPTYCSAMGKAQLAFETPETIAEVLGKKELKKFITKHHALMNNEQDLALKLLNEEEWDLFFVYSSSLDVV
ncbi:IclR family transcriptional regulator, partial [bacterium]|nr:IclR family transcriptional regulator [bacterium]